MTTAAGTPGPGRNAGASHNKIEGPVHGNISDAKDFQPVLKLAATLNFI